MKELEKASGMLKQFMDMSMEEIKKLDAELGQKKLELEAKEKEIEDVMLQMDYVDMLRIELDEKLDILMQERAVLDLLVEEKEMEARRHKLDNLLENMETNDGDEILDEGK